LPLLICSVKEEFAHQYLGCLGRINAHAPGGADEELVVCGRSKVGILRIGPHEGARVVGLGPAAGPEGISGVVSYVHGTAAGDARIRGIGSDLVVLPAGDGGTFRVVANVAIVTAGDDRPTGKIMDVIILPPPPPMAVKGESLPNPLTVPPPIKDRADLSPMELANPPTMAELSPPVPVTMAEPKVLLPMVFDRPDRIAEPNEVASTTLFVAPPIMIGKGSPIRVVAGMIEKARIPLTCSSRGSSSVVPRKWVPAVVPALPLKPHACRAYPTEAIRSRGERTAPSTSTSTKTVTLVNASASDPDTVLSPMKVEYNPSTT